MKAFPPLLFSVTYAATVSLEEAGFQHLFPGNFISCRELSARYRKATELALAEANFTESKNLSTLQALTLFMVNTKYSKFISSLERSNTSLFCSL
jgi:hypothetical protein